MTVPQEVAIHEPAVPPVSASISCCMAEVSKAIAMGTMGQVCLSRNCSRTVELSTFWEDAHDRDILFLTLIDSL